MNPSKRVCVVGAGIAGLCSARHLLAAGQRVTVLEATAHVGGTWRYDPRVGTDEFGRPIHTSMYEHLRTNLPKPTMEFPDFPAPADMPTFPSGKEYYAYLQSFAEHFQLNKHIKFLHEVTLITREADHWKVIHRSLATGEEFHEQYDYVFVCTGHHSKPNSPNLPGENRFKGTIIHSHDYRKPDPFIDRRVLIVGAGPSAMDIGLYLADFSRTIVHSHHSRVKFRTPFPTNYIQKPDVEEFTENAVRFQDGTFEEVDDVIYCTGFEYYYPFLDETSGLTVEPRSVTPLHRLVVNIRQPTMLLLGLVVRACLVLAIDAQARYGAALVSGNFSLPPEEAMMAEFQAKVDRLREQGKRLTEIHHLGPDEDDYYQTLSEDAGIGRVAPVLPSIRLADQQAKLDNLLTYREYTYTIHDRFNFTRVRQKDSYPQNKKQKYRPTETVT